MNLAFLILHLFTFLQFVISAPATSKTSPLAPAPTSSSLATCNGHASLCNVSYANVVYAGAHNSYAYGDGISDNQYSNISDGLVKGIRLMQAQGHDYPTNETTNPSGISLCHTSCYLEDGGSLESWLLQARNWLNANPREVLTILVTNPDSVNVTRWQKGFEYAGFNSTNVFSPSSQHTSRNDWPTLGQLIDSGKRTIAIMDYGANFTQLPWLIEEFSNIWENPYDQLTLPFNCSVDRGTKNDNLAFHNHVKDLSYLGISTPDKDDLTMVNAAVNNSNAIVPTVQRCTIETGVRPTYVMVDFYDIPSQNNIFSAVDMLNNVSTTPPTKEGKSAAPRLQSSLSFQLSLIICIILSIAVMTL
ncbi:PLC-like phosphodiesterase [Meira miltonrushii]|uniref:PLC-like phosphodiesterase n=1 Tax=Meira miltonrushii TaxID=1280837 RepID=A0A316V8F3_9BASI|nr:PLC-like phosphodiesterase [Meira miltonrushii]PWN32761.1 PLC-like phosphodiesterase [Meira miltonrushii]